ncbi:hypothetical protein LPA44_05455 [Halobacterium sp. KA-4]|uniref:hypothetical protein n=1 Tax=Halobacterium sp. KA-4 TaxID=2896367 RepID=UPI001E4A721C|nr:hypothetical protein [Halobacterium sp. KA-4]MCD2199345.1 hypothetical protein [Halobacterium sp. KA-4]
MANPTETSPSALAGVTSAVRNGWRTAKTVYYANSVSWRVLKSGALLFLGCFLWAGSNVLQSYVGWRVLDYTMAYGFVVLLYGPVHHLVVIPLALRWRRSSGLRQRFGKRLPTAMLAVFLAVVLIAGAFPAGAMTVDFGSAIGTSDSATAAQPELACTTESGGETIVCEVTNAGRVDRVVVTSAGEQLLAVDDPPYDFTVEAANVQSTMDREQFRVVLYDENGNLVRQYTRRLSTIGLN